MVNTCINRTLIEDDIFKRYSSRELASLPQETLLDIIYNTAASYIKDPDDIAAAAEIIMLNLDVTGV